MATGTKILIVDDHPVVLDGLVLILSDLIPQSEIVTACDGATACSLVDAHLDIDWIFLDINLPDINGIELLKQFDARRSTSHTVILSSDSNPKLIDDVLKHNASGYISKSFSRSELQRCISVIESGKTYLEEGLLSEVSHYRKFTLAERQRIECALTERQHQTLTLMATGYTNKEIAVSCNIAESSVKSRVKSLMELFRADNRTHCVHEARRLKII